MPAAWTRGVTVDTEKQRADGFRLTMGLAGSLDVCVWRVGAGGLSGEGRVGPRIPLPCGLKCHFLEGRDAGRPTGRVCLELGTGLRWEVKSRGGQGAGDTCNAGRKDS